MSNYVRYGVYGQNLNVVGWTIRQVRDTLLSPWGMPSDVTAWIDKVRVPEAYIVQPNDRIEFHRTVRVLSDHEIHVWLAQHLDTLVVVGHE